MTKLDIWRGLWMLPVRYINPRLWAMQAQWQHTPACSDEAGKLAKRYERLAKLKIKLVRIAYLGGATSWN